ncbi:MAG: hypothetical protein OEW05_02175 [Candidatus Aminicenantes bacterium]|nr:hypothetical protein [Candidatus Aminicenantes bacterium]
MTIDAKKLAELLPAIHRLHDARLWEEKREKPLAEFVGLLAEQVAAIEENLDDLHDDQFIETCADWVVPYIGDLVGCRLLHGGVPGLAGGRAEVANTIRYRRRKGTATMLEQLARDVTGWDARAVEFFERLALTQHMNHIRLDNTSLASLKSASDLETLSTPFEPFVHLGEVRSVVGGRGKYNIPNVGIFLWRLKARGATASPAKPAGPAEKRRFLFSPLGHNMPLLTKPEPEPEIAHLAGQMNVPLPISRRRFHDHVEDYYGEDKSIWIAGVDNPSAVRVCDLSDRSSPDDWGPAPPAGKVAIDPVLGRIYFGTNHPQPPAVSFYYGFSADMGGGEYERQSSFIATDDWTVIRVPGDYPTLTQALQAAQDQCVVIEITDNRRYQESLSMNLAKDQAIEIRSANGCRPLLELQSPLQIKGDEAEVTFNGFLISGGALHVGGKVKTLRIRHCTLVPGQGLKSTGEPLTPGADSLETESGKHSVEISHSIVGPVRLRGEQSLTLTDSILDATQTDGIALAGKDIPSDPWPEAAGIVEIERSTVIGKVHVVFLKLACNSILCSPVISKKLQDGCVRFSFVPWDSHVPRRHRCRPACVKDAERTRPHFTTLRYGRPGYGQLSRSCPEEIRRGADDGAEMGAFHDLFQPQREANLRCRLDEYLRFGLEAGIFYAS